MSFQDLLPLFNALNQLNLFGSLIVILLSILCFIELVRLIIVIYRSVKGRMNSV